MGRDGEQGLALAKGLAHQTKLVMFEIAQPAMDQLAGGGGGLAAEIVHFQQQHLQPAPGGIARDARAIDAAADDQQVEARLRRARHARLAAIRWSANSTNPAPPSPRVIWGGRWRMRAICLRTLATPTDRGKAANIGSSLGESPT